MSEITTMRELLDHARAGFAPTPDDRTRVRRSLALKAGLGALGATAASQSSAAAAATGATTTLAGLAKVFVSSVLVTSMGATVVVGVAQSLSPDASVEVGSSPPPSVAPLSPEQARTSAGRVRGQAQPHALEASVEASPVRSTEPAPGATLRARSAPTKVGVSASGQASKERAIDAELALLQNARAAANANQVMRALFWLDELDRRHPGGVLLEERLALRAMLSCRRGGEVAARYEAIFETQYPRSVYAGRVQAACAPPRERSEKSLTDPSEPGH